MSISLLLVQILNGLQLGILLYLTAAGVTLVLSIMNFISLAHGSFYMMGAYFAATTYNHTGSFLLAGIAGAGGVFALGILTERLALTSLYERGHLDQVLCTFGLILFFNELARMIWGATPYYMEIPDQFSGIVDVLGVPYPMYRFIITFSGILIAAGLWLLIHRTRLGMLIRAGATNREMVGVLGVNIRLLNTLLFGLSAALAGFSGFLVAPILSVQSGMGDYVLVMTLVVIIIGGIGSIRGAFFAALIVGLVDTIGRIFLPVVFENLVETSLAQAAAPAISSMLIYLLMVVILAFRPLGLFRAQ
jgi:branched-chain amino acid transport system permease protein